MHRTDVLNQFSLDFFGATDLELANELFGYIYQSF